jgi:lysophospholipase L1-like esterase
MPEKVIVAIGDSLTEGHRWDELDASAEVVNLGLSGDTAMGVYFRLNLLAHAHPNLVFLQVGVNDLSQGHDPLELRKTHQKIWRAIAARAPLAKLVVCSLIPVRETKFAWVADYLNNGLIRRTNAKLYLAAREANLPFIDLYSPMADSSEELPDDFTTDGVHLTEAAYKVWESVLKAYLKKTNF